MRNKTKVEGNAFQETLDEFRTRYKKLISLNKQTEAEKLSVDFLTENIESEEYFTIIKEVIKVVSESKKRSLDHENNGNSSNYATETLQNQATEETTQRKKLLQQTQLMISQGYQSSYDNFIKNEDEDYLEKLAESLKDLADTERKYARDFNNHLNHFGSNNNSTGVGAGKSLMRICNELILTTLGAVHLPMYLSQLVLLALDLPLNIINYAKNIKQEADKINSPSNTQDLIEYTNSIFNYVDNLINTAQSITNKENKFTKLGLVREVTHYLTGVKILLETLKANYNSTELPQVYHQHGLIASTAIEEISQFELARNNIFYILSSCLTSIIAVASSIATKNLASKKLAGNVENNVKDSSLNPTQVGINVANKISQSQNSTRDFSPEELKELDYFLSLILNTTEIFEKSIGKFTSGISALTIKHLYHILLPIITSEFTNFLLSHASGLPFHSKDIQSEITHSLKTLYALPDSEIKKIFADLKRNTESNAISISSLSTVRDELKNLWQNGIIRSTKDAIQYGANVITGPNSENLAELKNRKKAYHKALGKALFAFNLFLDQSLSAGMSQIEIRKKYNEICGKSDLRGFAFDEMQEFLKKFIVEEDIYYSSKKPEDNRNSQRDSSSPSSQDRKQVSTNEINSSINSNSVANSEISFTRKNEKISFGGKFNATNLLEESSKSKSKLYEEEDDTLLKHDKKIDARVKSPKPNRLKNEAQNQV
jgi:hypothetical protein